MQFSLLQLTATQLRDVAAARIPPELASRLEEHALPPPFVAIRSLALAAAGHPAPWSASFLIVRSGDNRIVGGCGFKTAPDGGRVEIGYGVAPCARGQGAATASVRLLLERAFEAGASEVLAEVSPQNLASIRVVEKAGFKHAGSRVDEDHETVVQWVRRNAA